MREQESCASSLRIGFFFVMASMRSRNFPSYRRNAWELRIHKKKQAHSLRFHRDFFSFVLAYTSKLYATHSTIIRQQQRLFGWVIVAFRFTHPFVWKLSCKRWVDGKKEERIEWIMFSVYVYENCHRVNEERSEIHDSIRKRKKKPQTRVTLRSGKRERLSFSFSDRPFCTMSQSIIRTNYLVVIKAVLNWN